MPNMRLILGEIDMQNLVNMKYEWIILFVLEYSVPLTSAE